MAQFQTLAECLQFIENLKRYNIPIPPEVMAEKEMLEERERIDENEFIFTTMKAHNRFMSEEKEQCVRDMVDQLLIDGPDATQPCLLLGNVQCGKTDTFESIMGLSMDRGIDVCVVMTKGTNTLTEQTLKRLNSDFKYFAESGRTDQKVIVRIFDIMDLIHMGLGTMAEDPRNRFIIVCKKESKNLQHLITLFTEKSPELARREVLIVDDEADFASRAYYQRKGEFELLRIAELIETFITIPHYYRYLQVTATPYSLYLQPDGTVHIRRIDRCFRTVCKFHQHRESNIASCIVYPGLFRYGIVAFIYDSGHLENGSIYLDKSTCDIVRMENGSGRIISDRIMCLRNSRT